LPKISVTLFENKRDVTDLLAGYFDKRDQKRQELCLKNNIVQD